MCPDRMIVTVVKVYLQLFCIKQKNTCFQTQLQKQQSPPLRRHQAEYYVYSIQYYDLTAGFHQTGAIRTPLPALRLRTSPPAGGSWQ